MDSIVETERNLTNILLELKREIGELRLEVRQALAVIKGNVIIGSDLYDVKEEKEEK